MVINVVIEFVWGIVDYVLPCIGYALYRVSAASGSSLCYLSGV